MGSTSNAAHGSHRSTIQSPTPLQSPPGGGPALSQGWGSAAPTAFASLPLSLFLSSPHWSGAPDNACRERAAPDQTPRWPSRSPSGPPRRGPAAPAGRSPGPAALGRSPPSAKRKGTFSPALKRSRSRPRRDARGARLLGAAFPGREGREGRGRQGGRRGRPRNGRGRRAGSGVGMRGHGREREAGAAPRREPLVQPYPPPAPLLPPSLPPLSLPPSRFPLARAGCGWPRGRWTFCESQLPPVRRRPRGV